MNEKAWHRRHQIQVTVLAGAILFLVLAMLSRGFSSHGPATAKESTPGATLGQARKLSPDLIEVRDAQHASLDGLAPGSREAQDRQRQAVQQLGLPLEVKTGKTGIVFRLIPSGSFTMGSPSSESERENDEIQQQVTLTKPLYCAKFEVTQGQWEQVIGSNPSDFKGRSGDIPVETVSWDDCQAFVTKLCQIEGVPQGTYRLLTEAEWEYACRAGSTGRYSLGESESSLGEYAWYDQNSGNRTHAVGQKRPNGWGLYDMQGNVWEWCQDWYGSYGGGSVTDPLGPASGVHRVYRGGGWHSPAWLCRSALRSRFAPGHCFYYLGLRLVRTTP